MNDLALISAAAPIQEEPITNEHKAQWNKFLDYVNTRGYRGSKDLDRRDTNLGKSLLDDYRKENPNTLISYDIIKDIQQNVAKDWEIGNKIQSMNGVTSKNYDNRQLSKPDGWLGSLTSNGYFPVAATSDNNTGHVIKDWGHDLQGYYNSLVGEQAQKIPVLSMKK